LRIVDLSNETEPSSMFWGLVQDLAYQIFQVIDLRLALVIALIGFLVTVGFDSSGHAAAAADLGPPTAAAAATTLGPASIEGETAGAAFSLEVGQSWATAQRLRHGTLTSAIMTSSRLTDAHFFTDLPSRQ
jgi:hypothetical protein